MPPAVQVHGLRQLQAAFARADKETRLGLRAGLRDVAEPVRKDAELNAQRSIRRIGLRWYKMRTGVTRNLVYVAPRQRGVKTKGAHPRRRGQGFMKPVDFGTLLMDRAMEPALRRHEAASVERFDDLLDRVANRFN